MSRSIVFGTPLDAVFSASNASATAEKMIDCMTSVAALGMLAHSRWWTWPQWTWAVALPKCRATDDANLPQDAWPRQRLRDFRCAKGTAGHIRAAGARARRPAHRHRLRPVDLARA